MQRQVRKLSQQPHSQASQDSGSYSIAALIILSEANFRSSYSCSPYSVSPSSVFSSPIPISITSAFPDLLLFPIYNLERWDGVGDWREVEEGGDICISMADPC